MHLLLNAGNPRDRCIVTVLVRVFMFVFVFVFVSMFVLAFDFISSSHALGEPSAWRTPPLPSSHIFQPCPLASPMPHSLAALSVLHSLFSPPLRSQTSGQAEPEPPNHPDINEVTARAHVAQLPCRTNALACFATRAGSYVCYTIRSTPLPRTRGLALHRSWITDVIHRDFFGAQTVIYLFCRWP